MLKQLKRDILDPPMRPLILRVVELRESDVAVLQGNDGARGSHHIVKLAHCLVPVADSRAYPETYK